MPCRHREHGAFFVDRLLSLSSARYTVWMPSDSAFYDGAPVGRDQDAVAPAARRTSNAFGSPGTDSTVKRIDLNEALIRHPDATFVMRTAGDATHAPALQTVTSCWLIVPSPRPTVQLSSRRSPESLSVDVSRSRREVRALRANSSRWSLRMVRLRLSLSQPKCPSKSGESSRLSSRRSRSER